MKFKPIIFLAVALFLSAISQPLELRGDVAPVVENGVSGERATWHIMALACLIGAIYFFVSAGVSLVRALRG